MRILFAMSDWRLVGGYIESIRIMDCYLENPLKGFKDIEFLVAENLEQAVRYLGQLKFDILITDFVINSLQDHSVFDKIKNAISLLRKIRAGNFEPLNSKNMPVIVYTSDYRFILFTDGENNGFDFLDSKRDILLIFFRDDSKVFVLAVKTALERATLPSGMVKVI